METMPSEAAPVSAGADDLDRYARGGLWTLPLWAALLLVSTLTHQPSFTTDFPAYARYVTTTAFLVSHLVASILGAAVGLLGLIALFVLLVRGAGGRTSRLALAGLVTSVLATVLTASVFGVAAFAQPAIGRAYLAGHADQAVAINSDVYGLPLFATALPGLLLFALGTALFGAAVARSGWLPTWAGVGLVLGGVLFAIVGFLIGAVQPVGAALMAVSTAWIAYRAGRARPAGTPGTP
jgi:hypothetical protein